MKGRYHITQTEHTPLPLSTSAKTMQLARLPIAYILLTIDIPPLSPWLQPPRSPFYLNTRFCFLPCTDLLHMVAAIWDPSKILKMQSAKARDFMFVKVNMDGVPIGRKIDLNVFDSYEKLARGVESMFKRFIAARSTDEKPACLRDSGIPELLRRGADFVLIYEDNEGDRMLVGDVPWDFFIVTVKRLRVIRGSDAYELGGSRVEEISQTYD